MFDPLIYHTAERKEFLPFATAWMELGSIMLSEISQAVKDKYHVISPISRTWSTKQTSEQNRTRDIEKKNPDSNERGGERGITEEGRGRVKERV